MKVAYSLTEQKSVQILSINSLLDEWQNRQILQELNQKIDRGGNQLVIDLTQLNLMTCSGINFLLSLFSKTQENNGALILANAPRSVQKILDITKLSTIFAIKPSVDQAVNCLTQKVAAA